MDQRQFFLRDILTVIFKHMRLLLFFPVAVLIVVIVGSYIWPPTYESHAKVKVMRGREVAQADPTVTSSNSMMMTQLGIEDVNSEIELMHSEDVLRATVLHPDLMLHEDSAFPYGTGPLAVVMKGANVVIREVLELVGLISVRTPEQIAIEELEDRLNTELVRDSYVIDVSLRMGNKQKAQQILGVLLEEHRRHHIETFANPDSVRYFQELLDNAGTQLKEAQTQLQAFRELNDISLLDTQKALLLANYTDAVRVLAQLDEAQNLISADAENIDSSVISTLSSETDSTVVREMQLRLLELLLERNRVQNSLGENHPTLQSLREQVRKAQSDLIEAISTTKQLTTSKRDRVLSELQKLNATKTELDELEKNVGLLTQNYDFYWSKREEAVVADAMTKNSVSNIKVISSPDLPTDPVYPNKLANIAIGLVVGIFGALALAFFFDYLDHGLKTPEDVEAYLKLAPMASFFNRPGEKLDKREAERLAIVLETMQGGNSNVLEVTSSTPGEGAAQVAMALADAYANDPEGATLMIDLAGDAGGRSAGAGITDVLLGQASIEDVFALGKGLNVAGRGSAGESATYLWGSEQMTQLLGELRRRYKHIIVNVGPVLRSHDALKLAKHVDGVVMVIRSDSTRREVVDRALDMFGTDRNRVIGAVLTERTQKIPQAVYRRI